ncbi:Manganese transport system membrane protein MntB [compost metagenome]
MLIVPAATAYLLTDRLGKMILYSVLVGAASSVGGYIMAYMLDASIAGCMVAVAGILFVLALLLSPKHGIIFRYARRKFATR